MVTAFVTILAAGLLLFAGLVIDGGMVLATKRKAIDDAESAARAGAQMIDVSVLRTTGEVVLLADQAEGAAQAYLADSGAEGTVEVVGDRIEVTVTRNQRMQILGIGGLGSVTVVGHGVSEPRRGVEEIE